MISGFTLQNVTPASTPHQWSSGLRPGQIPFRQGRQHFRHTLRIWRSPPAVIHTAAPLPVLGPGGPTVRVGLPPDDLGW